MTNEPELITIEQFCERYAVSRSTLYRLVESDDISLIKIGRASRIRLEEAERWARGLPGYEDWDDVA
tara:strand:- start:7068 stop:7268 length:201 start_codon:yes stop_codon:yes gene_type:complete